MTGGAPATLSRAQAGPAGGGRWADGCRHVFLDVGANLGVQTRKLFEPEAYPHVRSAAHGHNFSWVEAFARELGPARDDVCAFAFEANPAHTRRLRSLEACYAKRGWRAVLFAETAVAPRNGSVHFFADPVNAAKEQWAASLFRHGRHGGSMPQHSVAAIDLAAWVRYHVLQRAIPPPRPRTSGRGEGSGEGGAVRPPKVLMKVWLPARHANF